MEAPEECANCGAQIPRGAKSCPECGADERTGWRETSAYDGLELPGETESEREGEDGRARGDNRVNGIAWYWWLVGIIVILALVRMFVGLL